MNQRYDSAAIVKDGTTEAPFARDPDLYHQPSSRPGAHVPHARLLRKGKEISTLDLCGNGRFTVLTGITGAGWVAAAEKIASKSGLPIAARVIGPSEDAEDVYGDWARLREINEDGCLLLRPDQYVAFRAANAASNATAVLDDALSQVLGHQTTSKGRPARPAVVSAK
jgi:2,4-dichlorophenol 6-monooxygenase